jgi:hypothetical protein
MSPDGNAHLESARSDCDAVMEKVHHPENDTGTDSRSFVAPVGGDEFVNDAAKENLLTDRAEERRGHRECEKHLSCGEVQVSKLRICEQRHSNADKPIVWRRP